MAHCYLGTPGTMVMPSRKGIMQYMRGKSSKRDVIIFYYNINARTHRPILVGSALQSVLQLVLELGLESDKSSSLF